MDADTDTYYSLLETEESASAEEIKTAYRGLAREYHPDTLPPELRERRIGRDAEASLKLINEAYAVLSDPEQRARYDEQLRVLRAGEAPHAEVKQPCPPPAAARRPAPVTPKPRPASPKAPSSSRRTPPHKTAALLLLAAVIPLMIVFNSGAKSHRPENRNAGTKAAPGKAVPASSGEEVKKILKLVGAKLVERVPAETTEPDKTRAGVEARLKEETRPPVKAERPALIPAGEFLMDTFNDDGEPGAPPRKVYLDAFYIDKTEVTAGRYKAFAEATGRETMKQPPEWNTNKHPAVYVAWDDAAAYCEWAGGRLPTEEEWEKAARGGTDTKYHFGDEESGLGGYAWYEANSNGKAHPVGQKRPNQYGLYDMHGNVWEWVSGGGPRRYALGGGWPGSPGDLRRRYWHFPGYSNYDLGFRCVVPIAAQKHLI